MIIIHPFGYVNSEYCHITYCLLMVNNDNRHISAHQWSVVANRGVYGDSRPMPVYVDRYPSQQQLSCSKNWVSHKHCASKLVAPAQNKLTTSWQPGVTQRNWFSERFLLSQVWNVCLFSLIQLGYCLIKIGCFMFLVWLNHSLVHSLIGLFVHFFCI